MQQKCIWKGISKKEYSFNVYEKGTTFYEVPCIYVYSYINSKGMWEAVYVGQTSKLQTRIDQHKTNNTCIKNSGFTHIHVYNHNTKNKEDRLKIEQDIMDNYDWKCNKLGN